MGVFDGLVRIYESVRIYEFDIILISSLPNLFKHVIFNTCLSTCLNNLSVY